MGEVQFVMFDSVAGKPTGSVSGSPTDVADFLAIWMKNTEGGISLAQQLGVSLASSSGDSDEE